MIATIGRFLCLTNPHRSRQALFVRAKQHNGNPSDRSGASSPCAESQGEISCGGTVYFSNIGCPFTGERQPLRPQRRPAPLTQGSQGGVSCGGSVFFEYRGSFHGGTATPQAAATASSPYTGEPRGAPAGGQRIFRISDALSRGNGNPSGRSGGQLPLHRGAKRESPAGGGSVFFEYWMPFHGGTATPQAAATASSPYTGEPGGIHTGDPVQKRGSGGDPLGTLFFDLRQRLFGYCKNTSLHLRRR